MKKPASQLFLQRGISLIELMISITIGMIIMIAVISAYLGAAGASTTAEAIGRMNEDAQTAINVITQQLRMAGGNPMRMNRSSTSTGTNPRGNSVPQHNTLTNAYAVRGCDSTFSNVTSAAGTTALTCPTTGGDGHSSISIAYEADTSNTLPNGGVPTDCTGTALTAINPAPTYAQSSGGNVSVNIYEAENRYYIGTTVAGTGTNAITNPSLFCKGNAGGNALVLIENIEDMQITYAVVDPSAAAGHTVTLSVSPSVTSTQVLGSGMTANTIDTDATTLTGTAGSSTRWNGVRAVQICVVVRSDVPVLDNTQEGSYYNCANSLVTTSDRRLRRSYTTTVLLRNQ